MIGLDLETPLVPQVRGAGLDRMGALIFIQSFELTMLHDLRQGFGFKTPLVFLRSQRVRYDLGTQR